MPAVIDQITEPSRHLPVWYDVDVLVAGGGTAGIAAAICAGRLGLSVAMVEMTAQPGGMASHVNSWLNDFRNKGGFAREWLDRLIAAGAYQEPNYNPFVVARQLDELLAAAAVRPLYLAMAVMPLMAENRVTGAVIEGKSGRGAIRAKVVIDSTGDGDLAARAGAQFRMGRESDGACQAISLNLMLANWHGLKLAADTTRDLAIAAGEKAGTGWRLPYDHWGPKPMVGLPDITYPAVPHATGYDPTDVASLSDALIELRRQGTELVTTLAAHTSEFAQVRPGPFAALPGVRESRRIVTDRIITRDDVLTGARFDDGLFLVAQNIDIHKCTATEPAISLTKVKPYHLPYGALLPKGLEGILVVGRCIGGDHEALASYRIMADCFGMGEAAAIAAQLAIADNISPRAIAVSRLQAAMAKLGYEQ